MARRYRLQLLQPSAQRGCAQTTQSVLNPLKKASRSRIMHTSGMFATCIYIYTHTNHVCEPMSSYQGVEYVRHIYIYTTIHAHPPTQRSHQPTPLAAKALISQYHAPKDKCYENIFYTLHTHTHTFAASQSPPGRPCSGPPAALSSGWLAGQRPVLRGPHD